MQLSFKKQNKKETNNGIVKTFIHTSIPIHTPCTLLKHKKKEIKKKRRSTYQT